MNEMLRHINLRKTYIPILSNFLYYYNRKALHRFRLKPHAGKNTNICTANIVYYIFYKSLSRKVRKPLNVPESMPHGYLHFYSHSME